MVETYVGQEGIPDADALWSCAVPIVIHGDACPANRFSLDVLSWCGTLGRQLPTLDMKQFISALVNISTAGDVTQIHILGCHELGPASVDVGHFPPLRLERRGLARPAQRHAPGRRVGVRCVANRWRYGLVWENAWS